MNSTKEQNGIAAATEQVLASLLKGILVQGADPTIRTTTEFSKETSKIIIPEGMSKKDAANDLMNQWNNEEQFQNFTVTLEGWEWKDGLRAFRNVVEEKFGWLKGRETMFSTPTEISIVTGYKNGAQMTEIAYHGKVKFPAWEDCDGEVGVSDDGEVYVVVKAKKKYSPQINTFFKEVQNYLKNNSIYRGKPVVVTVTHGGRRVNLEIIEMKKNDKIFLNDQERLIVENLIIDQLDERGKACWLFTGTYGNGKSETAMTIGDKATQRGMTFFYLKDSAFFDKVLSFARKYEPCVVFTEDIDEIASGEDRDARMNAILNTLDGVQTKGRDIKVLFTTNHEKRINKALRRPGRIDLIVNFGNPHKETVEKIFNAFFHKLKGWDELDYDVIKAACPDVQGAVIAEIAKRAVAMSVKKDNMITTDRVLTSIASMEHQIKFMAEDVEAVNPVQAALVKVREFMQGETDF